MQTLLNHFGHAAAAAFMAFAIAAVAQGAVTVAVPSNVPAAVAVAQA